MAKDYLTKVIQNKSLAKEMVALRLQVEGEFPDLAMGQFVLIQVPGRPDIVLRRAFCIADYDKASKQISVVFRVIGEGTAVLARVQAGQELQVILPLGSGWDMTKYQTQMEAPIRHIWLVGGGIGVVPLCGIPKEYPQFDYTSLLGFRGKDDSVLAAYFDNSQIATDDGSIGHQGMVVDLLRPAYDKQKPDLILACGSVPFLRGLKNIQTQGWLQSTQNTPIPIYASFETKMACGVGACMGCVIKVDGQKKRVCKDAIFDLTKVEL
ncbi:MAG: dihydroorotate dehydrogenase electron transfer subunit [Firmicutes bacterium]|nr:dihydroorotate dehydrogenase electron transfer subunit [Bacillota bacterium]